MFSARAFGYLVGSVATGRLYDRLSGNRVTAVMLALMMVGMIAAPAIGLLPLLVVSSCSWASPKPVWMSAATP